MNKQFLMLSGIPRSGSSVLGSMLNQHPDIYASTTSPVVDLVDIINHNWFAISNALAQRHPSQYPNMIKSLCYGAYEHIDKNVIIDKNRLWPRYAELMKLSLGHKPKVICTVRDIPEIIASYILLIANNQDKVNFIDQDLIEKNLVQNKNNRCKIILEKYINHPYTSLRIAFNSPHLDLCVVSYNDIVNNSQAVMDKISRFVGVESIQVNLTNLQRMDENDKFHGGLEGLHDVRAEMKRTSPPAEVVLGKALYNYYASMKLEFWKNDIRAI